MRVTMELACDQPTAEVVAHLVRKKLAEIHAAAPDLFGDRRFALAIDVRDEERHAVEGEATLDGISLGQLSGICGINTRDLAAELVAERVVELLREPVSDKRALLRGFVSDDRCATCLTSLALGGRFALMVQCGGCGTRVHKEIDVE